MSLVSAGRLSCCETCDRGQRSVDRSSHQAEAWLRPLSPTWSPIWSPYPLPHMENPQQRFRDVLESEMQTKKKSPRTRLKRKCSGCTSARRMSIGPDVARTCERVAAAAGWWSCQPTSTRSEGQTTTTTTRLAAAQSTQHGRACWTEVFSPC